MENESAPDPIVSTALQKELLLFMENHPPARCSKNLRNLLLQFLRTPETQELTYLQETLYDMEGLFDLLDSMMEEKNDQC